MRFLRKIPMAGGIFFLAVGLLLCVGDIIHIHLYGIDIFSGNEFVADDGQIVDGPTGEAPEFMFIPAYVYAVGCWLAASIFFAFLPLAWRNSEKRRFYWKTS